MTTASLSEYLVVLPFLGTSLFLFLYSRDLVQKQIALFAISYIIFVVLSEYFFGLPFSRKAQIGNIGIDVITPTLFLFWFTFYFTSKISLGKIKINYPPLCHPFGKSTTITTIALALPLFMYFLYVTANNGVNISETFQNQRDERSTLQSYLFVYFAVLVSHYRKSRFLFVVGMLAAVSHVTSGERQRAFVYIMLILINYFQMDTRKIISSVVLLFGFVVATLLSQLRSVGGPKTNQYNINHFGEVSVSSLYLYDFGLTLNWNQKTDFLLGTLAANIIPSSWLPEAYNIRAAILNYANIPGGGWFPTFLQVQAGLIGVMVSGWLVARFYNWLLAGTRGHTTMQPAFYAATLVFISTTPIWFMYTPYQVFKMPLYAFLLSAVIVLIARQTSRPSIAFRRIP